MTVIRLLLLVELAAVKVKNGTCRVKEKETMPSDSRPMLHGAEAPGIHFLSGRGHWTDAPTTGNGIAIRDEEALRNLCKRPCRKGSRRDILLLHATGAEHPSRASRCNRPFPGNKWRNSDHTPGAPWMSAIGHYRTSFRLASGQKPVSAGCAAVPEYGLPKGITQPIMSFHG